MAADGLLTFLVAITVLTLAPGADTVLVIRNALRAGMVDGFATTIGICSGLFIHATASAVGISLILLQSAWLFTGLKYLGACYLLYLGFVTLRDSSQSADLVAASAASLLNVGRSLREGLLSNLFNPKPIIFYMAFLPQFINPLESALSQSLQLAAMHFVISLVWLGCVAAMAHQMRLWLKNPKIKGWINRTLGVALCGFGLLLASETYRE